MALALALPACAFAQLGGSLSVDTDYRFRGISLNDEQPDARASLAYDHASGAYAGLSVTAVKFPRYSRGAGVLGYAGFGAPLAGALRWEAGATWSHFAGASVYDYGELYAGVLTPRWSLRGYLSPDYFGLRQRTLYLEADAAWPLAERWHLLAHLGALRRVDGEGGNARFDARVGAVWHVAGLELQLSWVGVRRGGEVYPNGEREHRSVLVLGAAWAF